MLVSSATLAELAAVLARPEFDPCVGIADRRAMLRALTTVAESVPVTRQISACREPKDNTFLEGAVGGDTVMPVTGERDLPDLNPFRNIAIVRPQVCADAPAP